MIDDLIYLLAMLGGGCLLLGVTGWLSDRYYFWCLRQEDKPRIRRPLRVRKVRHTEATYKATVRPDDKTA